MGIDDLSKDGTITDEALEQQIEIARKTGEVKGSVAEIFVEQRKRKGYSLLWYKGGLPYDVIEYKDEDPGIRELYEKELAKEGVKSCMTSFTK